MKLLEALQTVERARSRGGEPWRAALLCGFEPLHLETFLSAHLGSAMGGRPVALERGLYGDLLGSLERLAARRQAELQGAAVALEWPDLDPRLGWRRLGGWGPSGHADLVASVRARLSALEEALARVAEAMPVALALPTLPLPPVALPPGWQASGLELALEERLAAFGAAVAARGRVRLVGPSRLARLSPPGDRFDARSELVAGFPYRLPHADALAALLARLLCPPPRKKGLITDLDGVLWRGILGEVGVEGVAWDLDHGAQHHGLYQQLLAALAEAGVLVGVTSKNDPALVDQALGRKDLVLPRDRVFPVEAGWRPKSESVSRILAAWNVAADAVVFVDDTPLELGEVSAAEPELECILFPDDPAQAVALLEDLRDRFGKEQVSAEDGLRLDSLRAAARMAEGRAAADQAGGRGETFLAGLDAAIELFVDARPTDPRALELVNKTNQWNLNGRRYTEAEWQAALDGQGAFLVVAGYRDKYGPLGKISVLAGRRQPGAAGLAVFAWVLSCRAFSRRIEHRLLDELYRRFQVDEIGFDFASTPRNGPLQEFFAELLGQPAGAGGPLRLSRAAFRERCPALHHRLEEPSS